jgi:RNase adaptor protein for sRNA GlmZ degradation
MSPFHKLNFIRNTIKKFGKNHFITKKLKLKEHQTVIIGEGISHLYQNIITQNSSNQEKLLKGINQIVSLAKISHTIVIVTANNQTIFERLKTRGHKRISREDEIEVFIKIGKHHIKTLQNHFKHIITIENNRESDLESQLKKI